MKQAKPISLIKKSSIRRQLLLWVTIPMLYLIPLETTILYQVGNHFIKRSFDEGLLDTAGDIIALMQVSKVPPSEFALNKENIKVLFSDQYDRTYYSIYNENGNFISGDKKLVFIKPYARNKNEYFSYDEVNHQRVRVVTVKQSLIGNQAFNTNYYVQVAETLNKRIKLSHQILAAIFLPQLILLIVSIGMLLLGVSKGLKPLNDLNEAIAKRSDKQLEPVQLSNVPEEAGQLVESINSLISKLKKAMELQNRFIADAAHQLRTPLAGIQAQLELAQTHENNKSELDMVNKSVGKLVHLVNQLLKLARNQPESINALKFEQVDLFLLTKDVCSDLFPFAYHKNIDFGFEFKIQNNGTNYLILADSEKLKILIQNLIDNAIRYTKNGGKVTVFLDEDDKNAFLYVEDNGYGIPEPEREKVFERFHRVIENSQEGSGLGLSIVKEIVLMHNATISIESPDLGEGTVFIVCFNKNRKPDSVR